MNLKNSLHVLFTFTLALLSTLFTFSLTFAEQPVKLDEVVVTATRIEESIQDVAQDVTVITKKQIESGSYQSVSEIIRNVAALNVIEYGSRGSASTVSMRTSTAGQVLVMIDGKRLNKPGDGQVDLNTVSVPLENIERIEVLRGASSALYGADAMGGVINIITKIPDQPVTNLSASYGRFVTKDISLSTSQKIKNAGFYLSLSKESSDGFRKNSDYDTAAVSTKLTYAFTKDIRADITLDYNHKDAGSPGPVTWLTPLASQEDENFLAGINVKIKDTLLKLYSHNARIDYVNPGSEDNTHRNHILGLDLQHSLSIGSSNLLTGGIEIIEEKINSSDNINDANSIGKHGRTRKGIFLQNETSLAEKAILTIGLRYDSIASEERFSPKASVLIKLPWQTNLSLSAGQGFRVPEMNALYWPDTDWAVGNPDLKPEKSTEYEINMQKFFGNTGHIKVVGFEKRSTDLIQWQEISPFKWSPVNVSKARIRGFETEGKLHFDVLDLGLSYTFMDPEDRTADDKIRFSTRHQIKGSASVYPMKDTTVSFEASYISRYVVRKGDPGCYFLLDGKISRKIKLPKGTTELFITGKNILDRDYQTTKDYPMPPVRFSGGISYSF
jgi:outer membrane cobalamin receptor